jgi:hypothetical protein
VDPSSPNILSVPYVGDNVLAKLRRPFWTELESRFGNMFNVREKVSGAATSTSQAAAHNILQVAALQHTACAAKRVLGSPSSLFGYQRSVRVCWLVCESSRALIRCSGILLGCLDVQHTAMLHRYSQHQPLLVLCPAAIQP